MSAPAFDLMASIKAALAPNPSDIIRQIPDGLPPLPWNWWPPCLLPQPFRSSARAEDEAATEEQRATLSLAIICLPTRDEAMAEVRAALEVR